LVSTARDSTSTRRKVHEFAQRSSRHQLTLVGDLTESELLDLASSCTIDRSQPLETEVAPLSTRSSDLVCTFMPRPFILLVPLRDPRDILVRDYFRHSECPESASYLNKPASLPYLKRYLTSKQSAPALWNDSSYCGLLRTLAPELGLMVEIELSWNRWLQHAFSLFSAVRGSRELERRTFFLKYEDMASNVDTTMEQFASLLFPTDVSAGDTFAFRSLNALNSRLSGSQAGGDSGPAADAGHSEASSVKKLVFDELTGRCGQIGHWEGVFTQQHLEFLEFLSGQLAREYLEYFGYVASSNATEQTRTSAQPTGAESAM